jgi:hypothetical protein
VIGRTGSGKTHAAVWHLSQRDFTQMPWVIFDFKRDDLINDIPGLVEISVSGNPPSRPGLYVVHPLPGDPDVEDFLWKIWTRGNVGLYIDEGYMFGQYNKAWQAILTQGRSKRIPVILLSQRPAWLDRFALSESDFFQIFQLNQASDRKRVKGLVPEDVDLERDARDWQSHYYDVKNNVYALLRPMPSRDKIMSIYRQKMANLKRPLTDEEERELRRKASRRRM